MLDSIYWLTSSHRTATHCSNFPLLWFHLDCWCIGFFSSYNPLVVYGSPQDWLSFPFSTQFWSCSIWSSRYVFNTLCYHLIAISIMFYLTWNIICLFSPIISMTCVNATTFLWIQLKYSSALLFIHSMPYSLYCSLYSNNVFLRISTPFLRTLHLRERVPKIVLNDISINA